MNRLRELRARSARAVGRIEAPRMAGAGWNRYPGGCGAERVPKSQDRRGSFDGGATAPLILKS